MFFLKHEQPVIKTSERNYSQNTRCQWSSISSLEGGQVIFIQCVTHYELNIYFVSPSKISEPHSGSCANSTPTALMTDCTSFDFHAISHLVSREKPKNQECQKCKHSCVSPWHAKGGGKQITTHDIVSITVADGITA